MAGKVLKWSPRAKKELNAILRYFRVRNRSSTYSHKLSKEFRKASERIRQNEKTGQFVEPNRNIRFVIVAENYQMFYRLEMRHNTVVTIWDARRNPDDLKFD